MKKILTLALVAAMLTATGITAFAAPVTADSDPKTGGTTVNYTVDPAYTVVIPESVTLGDTAVTEQIKIYGATENDNVVIGKGQKVNVALTESANDFNVANTDGDTIAYTVNDKNAVADLTTVAECTVDDGKKDTDITFAKTGTAAYAGTYTDTLTFTVSLAVALIDINYMEYNAATNTFTEKTQAIPMTNNVTSSTTELNDGWYYVEGTVVCDNRITVNGTVNLILCDGADLTANKGITVAGSNTLNIYAQTNGTGKLTATTNMMNDMFNAGIGGANGSCGTITINGGNVTATGANCGAGIGGGNGAGGTITINGGTVIATGRADSAGIGGGENGYSGTITINGGNVTANGGNGGSGIGSGTRGGCGTVTINGGTVTANGGGLSAGIGGGMGGNGGDVAINGGTVTANGGYNGVGIGGGMSSSTNGTLTVADGLGVFGGTSANPTTVITNYDTNRPQYMVVKAVPATGVTLNKTTLALIDGQSQTLQATVSPDEATDKSVTWESNKTSVATVDSNGKVTAVDGGTAVITAKTANGKTASCTVTVEKLVAFDKTKYEEPTTVGQSGIYKNLSYDTALAYAKAKSALTNLECIVVYEITQKYGHMYECEAVCSNGESGTIDSDIWEPYMLSNHPENVFYAFGVDEEVLPNIEVYYAVPTEVTSVTYAPYYLIATPGQSATFSTTAFPTSLAGSTTFTYSSSNPNVATVSNNGTITALSAGTTTIKVTTDNGVEASCTLKVQADAPQYANKLVRTTNYTSIKNQVKEINQNEAKELAAYMAFKDQQNATVGYRIPSTYESYFTIEVVSSDKEGSDWTWAHGIANSGLIKGNFYYVSNS